MASALKHRLAKVLHRGGDHSDGHPQIHTHQANAHPHPLPPPPPTHYADANGAAPSPAISRTSEDKRYARTSTSSSVREFVRRSASRSQSRSARHIASRSSKDYSQHPPALPRGAGSSVRRVDDQKDLSSKFKQSDVNGTHGSANVNGHAPTQHDGSAGNGHTAGQHAKVPAAQHIQKDGYGPGPPDARDESTPAGGLEDMHTMRQALQSGPRDDAVQPRPSREGNREVGSVGSRTIPAAAVPSRDGSLDWRLHNGAHRTTGVDTSLAAAPEGQAVKNFSTPAAPEGQAVKNFSTPAAPEGQAVKNFSTPSTQPRAPLEHLVQDSDASINLEAHGINLTDTEDTTVHETVAPAVVHETVRADTHEIINERIEREIHTHDVYHRILPIVDVEVLPPRHFILTPTGSRYEISADEAPGGAAQNLNLQRVIQEAVDRELARLCPPQTGPRKFTALEFDPRGSVGDYKEGVGEDGCRFSEQTWVHPPVIDMGGYESGQTVPFHFEHAGAQSARAGGVVGDGSVVDDDHHAGVGRLPTVGGKTVPGRRGSVPRKPVPLYSVDRL